jgi:hypothetical protein
MKNCVQCGTATSDEIKFCSECGLRFSFEGQPENTQTIETPAEVTRGTSGWIKIGAACLVLLTGMFGYQQFSESKSRACRAQALSNRPTAYSITDVKWSFLGCQFLTSFVNLDSDEARWRSYDEVFPSDEALSEARESILREK